MTNEDLKRSMACPYCHRRITITVAYSVVAKWLGRMASSGGHARAASLSPERRREIAQLAAAKRWGRDKGDNRPSG